MHSPRGNSKKWLWFTLTATVTVLLVVQVPLLIDHQYVDEDLRFFYWLHRFVNPSMFEGDPLLGHQFAQVDLGFTTLLFNKVSLLYGAVYAVFSPFFSPFVFSKLLIFPLGLISSYYLFQIGERIIGYFAAFLLTIIFTVILAVPHSSIALATGLPRAFTAPLLLMMLYYLIVDNYLGMAAVLVISLVYPPIFLTILLTYGVKYTLESLRDRSLILTARQFTVISVALFICVLLLLPAITTGLNTVPTDANRLARTSVYESPLYGSEGRYPLLEPSPLASNGGLIDTGIVGAYSLGLTFLLIPAAAMRGRRFNLLSAPFWYLVLASLIGFGISWLAILLTPSAIFHMPSRYTRGTIFIMGLTLFFVNGPRAIRAGSQYIATHRGYSRGLVIIAGMSSFLAVYFSGASRAVTILIGILVVVMIALILIVRRHPRTSLRHDEASTDRNQDSIPQKVPGRLQLLMVALLMLVPLLLYIQRRDGFYRPQPAMAELVSFMKTLPESTLISGYPCYLDDIPLYSQRMVLYSCEIESRNMGMMRAVLDAYFAEDEEEVVAFCRQYGVDYMVASHETFTEQFRSQEHILFEPLNSFVRQLLAGRSKFVLDQIPEDRKIFQNERYFIFPCTAHALTIAG